MENLDAMVLRTLRDWRRAGRRALLATVVRTWGSSPRPVGSIMAMAEDGAVVGSVSGGCIEDDLIHRYTAAYARLDEPRRLPSGAPAFVKYLHQEPLLPHRKASGAAEPPGYCQVLPGRVPCQQDQQEERSREQQGARSRQRGEGVVGHGPAP